MFTHKFKLFRLFGFSIEADATWILLAVLVTWSLATGLFPHYFEGFSARAYWTMAVLGAAGLFMSIILHELGHSRSRAGSGCRSRASPCSCLGRGGHGERAVQRRASC